MIFSSRVVLIFCCITILHCDSFNTKLVAQEGPLLKKRIAELEAENRALRKVISDVQQTLKDVPLQSATSRPNADGLRIIVLPDDWGDSGIEDIKKVADSTAHPIASLLESSGFSPILLQRSRSGPVTLYKRGVGNEYIVKLDTEDRAWAQLAFQFAHEFCHILCNYRNVDNPQLWFEETICEVASLYSLRQMGEHWKTNPPYSNWKSYSVALTNYANDRIDEQQKNNQSLAEFYRNNMAALTKSGTDRELNNFIAIKLLKTFEQTPSGWQSIRYLNLGEAGENDSFQAYLSGWYQRVPEKHRPFVAKIAKQFELDLFEN